MNESLNQEQENLSKKALKDSVALSYIFSLSKYQYRKIKNRSILKIFSVFLLIIAILLGPAFAGIYFAFIKPSIRSLKQKLSFYQERIDKKSEKIALLEKENIEYKQEIQRYNKFISGLKIEDQRLIDYNLLNRVKEVEKEIDSITTDFTNFYRGNKNIKETALTFDIGTGEEIPFVYRVLKEYGIPATIFISNTRPSLTSGTLSKKLVLYYLRKLKNIGCEFGNHTWSHYNLVQSLYETSKKRRIYLTPLSDDVIDEISLRMEFKRVQDRLYYETGIRLARIWRAPYGAIDSRILKLAAEAGYRYHIFWSFNTIGPLDFFDYITKNTITVKDKNTGKLKRVKNPYFYTSTETLQRLINWEKADPYGLNGAISIAHLGTARKIDKPISILPEYIEYCRKKGYRFVKVTDLIKKSGGKI